MPNQSCQRPCHRAGGRAMRRRRPPHAGGTPPVLSMRKRRSARRETMCGVSSASASLRPCYAYLSMNPRQRGCGRSRLECAGPGNWSGIRRR